jgi:hypothetical protein
MGIEPNLLQTDQIGLDLGQRLGDSIHSLAGQFDYADRQAGIEGGQPKLGSGVRIS